MRTKIVKERSEPGFELICDSYMKRGYRMVNAGFTPGRTVIPNKAWTHDSWWAVLVLESDNDDRT